MKFTTQLGALLRKEFQLEWKQKYALNGLLLYALTMVFVISLALFRKAPTPETWNVIFWIILLFVGVNAVAKSFMGESSGQMLYLYGIASPQAVIGAKMIYNALLLSSIAMITMLFYFLLSGINPAQNIALWIVSVLLGTIGFAANLTLVSSIAAKGKNSSTLLAVLGFPLLIPQLLSGIVSSNKAILGLQFSDSWTELAFSGSFFVIIAMVSLILFPFIWKD